MSKINFSETWSVLRGVKAPHVDFAGPNDTSSKTEGAFKGKGKAAGGAAVEAKNRAGKGTQKLSGRKCIMPDGSVNPQCEEYNPSLVGREKLLDGSDEGTIRENIKRLMHGDAGYSSAYLQNGKHGHTYTARQAAAIAYKKAGKAGPATGGSGGDKTAKQKFLDKHLPKYHRTSFENKAQAREALHRAYDDHKLEVGKTTEELKKYLQANPDAAPEQIMADLKQAGIGKGLDEDDIGDIIENVTGQSMPGRAPQAMPKLNPMGDEEKDAYIDQFNSKYGSDIDAVIENIAQKVGMSDKGPDEYTPEQYQQLLAELQKQFPKLSQDELMKVAQASNFEPSLQKSQAQPRQPGAQGDIAKRLYKALGGFTSRGTSSRGWSKADREGANTRQAALNDQRDLAALPPEEKPEILDKIGQAIKAKPAPPPQRPGMKPRETAPQNPDTKQRMAAADQKRKDQEKQNAAALRNAADQVIKEQRSPAPVSDEDHSKMGSTLADLVGKAKGSKIANSLAKQFGLNLDELHNFLQEATRRATTPPAESNQTSNTKAKPAPKAKSPASPKPETTPPATEAKEDAPSEDKKDKPAPAKRTRRKKTEDKVDASEHNLSAPYGWSFSENATPKTNVVGGEDANRNLIKIPETWSQR